MLLAVKGAVTGACPVFTETSSGRSSVRLRSLPAITAHLARS